MFYGRQLAAAALRSHRPQTTLRAAAQVSSPCSLWPRGSAGKAQGRGPAPGLSAALARPGCPALHRGCGPGLELALGAARLGSVPRPLEARQGGLAVGLACGSLPERSQRRRGLSLPGANASGPPLGKGMPFKCTLRSSKLS